MIRNQRGITLIELLVTIVLMTVVLAPISLMVIYSLKSEREVSSKNDVQREARFIMEQITEKMRDKSIAWQENDGKWELKCKNTPTFTCSDTNTYLTYTETSEGLGTMRLGSSGEILSSHVRFSPPVASSSDTSVTVAIEIDKTEDNGEKISLESTIYFDRFVAYERPGANRNLPPPVPSPPPPSPTPTLPPETEVPVPESPPVKNCEIVFTEIDRQGNSDNYKIKYNVVLKLGTQFQSVVTFNPNGTYALNTVISYNDNGYSCSKTLR